VHVLYRNIGANYRGDKLVNRSSPLAASLAGAGFASVLGDIRLRHTQLDCDLILGQTLNQKPPQLGNDVIPSIVAEQCELAVLPGNAHWHGVGADA
jgi:hypothetical protein